MHHSCWLAPALLLVASVALLQCGSDEQSLGSNRTDTLTAGAGGAAGAPNSAGAGGQIATARRICDGSTGLTFGYTIRGGGPQETGSYVLYEVGYGSFYIDGQCRYWAIDPDIAGSGPWNPVHAGTLTPAQEQQLMTDFAYTQWPTRHGDYSGKDVPLDAGGLIAFDRTWQLSCAGTCKPDAPKGLSQGYQWHAQLYAQGSPVTTPIRLRALPALAGDATKVHPWTLSLPLESLALSPNDPSWDEHQGDAPLITDLADLLALRKIRAEALAAQGGYVGNVYVEQSSPSVLAKVFFRDTIPLEDEHGLIPIPAP